MTVRYLVSRIAEQDIEETVSYLLGERPGVAPRFIEACIETFELLAAQPQIGRIYGEALDPRLDGLRVFPVKGYRVWVVIYRDTHGMVRIERVLHGARDLPRVLGDLVDDSE